MANLESISFFKPSTRNLTLQCIDKADKVLMKVDPVGDGSQLFVEVNKEALREKIDDKDFWPDKKKIFPIGWEGKDIESGVLVFYPD